MGMVVLTFYAYRGENGRIFSEVWVVPGRGYRCRWIGIFNRHEEIAANAGQNRVPFIDSYEELTTTLQVKFLDYTKLVLEPPTGETVPTATEGRTADFMDFIEH